MRSRIIPLLLKIVLLLTVALTVGCANKYALTPTERQLLAQADTAAGKKRFADSEKIYQTIIEQSSRRKSACARQAILGIARIHVAYDNPDANWRTALLWFTRYDLEYPMENNVTEIRSWIRILTALQSFEEKYGSTQTLYKKIKTLERTSTDSLELIKNEIFRYKSGSDTLLFQRDSLIRETKRLQTTILKMEKIR